MGKTIRTPVTVTVLPASAPDGQLISYQDDLYIGCGADLPLKRLSAADPVTLTVPTDTTSVTFNNLDINKYQGYTLVAMIKSQNASYGCYLYFNGVTNNSNYGAQKMNAAGTKQTDAKTNNALFADTQANYPTYAIADIDIISGYPVSMSRSIKGSLTDVTLYHSMLNIVQTNITSITITAANSNGIKAGSKFLLYRRG